MSRTVSFRGIRWIAVLALLFACRLSAAELSFPRDHGPHPQARIESWYFNGHLAADSGRSFAFHLAFFRIGVGPEDQSAVRPKGSAWTFDEIYRAELGITDLETGQFKSFEHLSRAALGLAGSSTTPVRVWVNDWFMEVTADDGPGPRFRVHAKWADEAGISLKMEATKPVLVSDRRQSFSAGASRGRTEGYALTRMTAAGELAFGVEPIKVNGNAWLDRLWREISFDQLEASLERVNQGGFLSSGQIVVNRFALQLNDGRELLLFQLRRRDGSGTPVTSGALVDTDGSSRVLDRDALALDEEAYWTSDLGTRYPVSWRIDAPAEGIALKLKARGPDQEVRQSVRYWSGALEIIGEINGLAISGRGHAALAGYWTPTED